jgi:hypothetical protein
MNEIFLIVQTIINMYTPAEKIIFIGLDGETSSLQLENGGRLIQAGVALNIDGNFKVFNEYISWAQGMKWDQEAEAVHGIPQSLAQNGRYAQDVDLELSAWLIEELGEISKGSLISVGWNVAAFDHPFFNHALPTTMSYINRRAVELNSLCYAETRKDPYSSTNEDFELIKSQAKAWGVDKLSQQDIIGREHDAGYDAALGLMVFGYFNQI